MPPKRLLATYIATSARWSRRSTSSPWSGKQAMPTLASTVSVTPWTTNGSCSAATSRLASRSVSAASSSSGSRTANSSPPRRATVSTERSEPRSRAAERVVDLLEAVEVEHQHAGVMALGGGLAGGGDRALAEQRPVGQLGEPIVQRLMLGGAGVPARAVDRGQRQQQERQQQVVVRLDGDDKWAEAEHQPGRPGLEAAVLPQVLEDQPTVRGGVGAAAPLVVEREQRAAGHRQCDHRGHGQWARGGGPGQHGQREE